MEVRQAQGALLSSAAQLLELETAKALDVIKQETAAALAKYEQAGKQEAARSVALTRRFEEEAKQVCRCLQWEEEQKEGFCRTSGSFSFHFISSDGSSCIGRWAVLTRRASTDIL